MSKWENTKTGNIFYSYEEACDEIYDNLLPDEVIEYIMNFYDDYYIIEALNGSRPNFYTDKLMELAEKQCADYIVEILEDEEEEEKDGEI